MNKYKLLFKIFVILCFLSNFFIVANGKTLEKKSSRQDDIVKNDSEKNIMQPLYEDYDESNDMFSMNKLLKNKRFVQYNITGMENKFNLSDKELKKVYNINGTEIVKYSKKLLLTKYQKAQIEYLEMERKYKTLILDNEIKLKKKMLNEELASDFADVFLIDALSKDIKSLAVDKQTVDINVEKKIRYILTSEQYLKYRKKQNKKNK